MTADVPDRRHRTHSRGWLAEAARRERNQDMGSRTRRTVRGLAGLAAAASLAIAVAVPAFASHVEPTPIGQNKSCGQLGAYDHEFKIDATPTTGTYSDPDSDFEVDITMNSDGSFDFESNLAVDAVFVKGGREGGNLYVYDPPVTSDEDLDTPTGQEISHVSFCFDDQPEESQPEESQPEESQPEESQPEESLPEESQPEESLPEESQPEESLPEESQPEESLPEESQPEGTPQGGERTPAESEREGTLGGTPAPSGGTVPNTAAQPWTGVPASVLGLVLLASLGALVYVRLAQEPIER
jgi:hypothetical protein